jgi:PIN domain nuclease of toxin-antitoxin system
VKILIDTHVFLWWLAGDERLSGRARSAIEDAETVLVSAASVWEISTKHRLGKLPGVEAIVSDLPRAIRRQGFEALPITAAQAQRAGSLPGDHRDPFDRMLIAQALELNVAIASVDAVFDRFGVDRLW